MKPITAVVALTSIALCTAQVVSIKTTSLLSHSKHSDISQAIPFGAQLSTDTNQFIPYQYNPREPNEFDYYENEDQKQPAPAPAPAPVSAPATSQAPAQASAPAPAQKSTRPTPQPISLDQVTRKPKPSTTSSSQIEPTITAVSEGLNTVTVISEGLNTITAVSGGLNTTTAGPQLVEVDVKVQGHKKSSAVALFTEIYAVVGSLAAVAAVFFIAM